MSQQTVEDSQIKYNNFKMQSPKTGMDFNGQVRWKGIFWYEKELRSPPRIPRGKTLPGLTLLIRSTLNFISVPVTFHMPQTSSYSVSISWFYDFLAALWCMCDNVCRRFSVWNSHNLRIFLQSRGAGIKKPSKFTSVKGKTSLSFFFFVYGSVDKFS